MSEVVVNTYGKHITISNDQILSYNCKHNCIVALEKMKESEKATKLALASIEAWKRIEG